MLYDGQPVDAAAACLRALVDGYDASNEMRSALPDAMYERTHAMYELLHASHGSGIEPWGRMFSDGHGEFWRSAANYVGHHRRAWAVALSR